MQEESLTPPRQQTRIVMGAARQQYRQQRNRLACATEGRIEIPVFVPPSLIKCPQCKHDSKVVILGYWTEIQQNVCYCGHETVQDGLCGHIWIPQKSFYNVEKIYFHYDHRKKKLLPHFQ